MEALTREQTVAHAEARGWKVWGQMRKVDGSSYQCFRRGNDYLWIGYRYVQRTGYATAEDFVADRKEAIALMS